MKHLFYIILALFLFCLTANSSFGQKDAFKSRFKKGPNIYSPKRSRTNSKTKRYSNSISKKKSRRKNAVFSSKRKRFGSIVSGVKGSKSKGSESSSGGRKSSKGRKKEK